MKTSHKVIYWLPRIICILAILFASMFALDSFGPGRTIWQQLVAFFMHMIPSCVLIVILLVSWRWEMIGGIIFLVIGLGMSPLVFMLNHNRNHFSVGNSLLIVLAITFPFVVVGILFIVSHLLKKKNLPAV